MLLGSLTQGEMLAAAKWICNSISGCRTVILEGQAHGAMLSAPDLFVSKLLEITAAEAAAS